MFFVHFVYLVYFLYSPGAAIDRVLHRAVVLRRLDLLLLYVIEAHR